MELSGFKVCAATRFSKPVFIGHKETQRNQWEDSDGRGAPIGARNRSTAVEIFLRLFVANFRAI